MVRSVRIERELRNMEGRGAGGSRQYVRMICDVADTKDR